MKTRELDISIADQLIRLVVDEKFYDDVCGRFALYCSAKVGAGFSLRRNGVIEQAQAKACGYHPAILSVYTIRVMIADKVMTVQKNKCGIAIKGTMLVSAAEEFFGIIDLKKREGSVTVTRRWAISVLANFLKNVVSYLVFLQDGLMLHASGLVRDGEAYVFFGPSGIGKSTVAKVSTQCSILSDELVAVVPQNDGFFVYGTPSWSEGMDEERKAPSKGYPLKGLFKLVQDTDVYLEELCYSHAFADLFTVPEYCRNTELTNTIMHSLSELVLRVPCYELHFLPDDSLWRCIDEYCTVCA